MIRLNLTALSLYGKKITNSLKATESELLKHCSCPPGESCSVEINELPNKCFEVIVIRPRPLTEPTDWVSMAPVTGKYRRRFEKRTTAERIREAVAEIVGAPIEEEDTFDVPATLPTEEQDVVLVDLDMLRRARKLIAGCEACSPYAEIPFDNILDQVSGHRLAITRYILEEPVKCPGCLREVTENTLVEIRASIDHTD